MNEPGSNGLSIEPLLERYSQIRESTEKLASPLAVEDCVVQSMPDVSPTRWHLAHTTWFFETFVLARASSACIPVNPAYMYLFNSYYNSVGDQFPRPRRGLLSRPTVAQVLEYRRTVDRCMAALLQAGRDILQPLLPVIELGLHHEQQHQELILTDIKHVLSCNPLCPAYIERAPRPAGECSKAGWKEFPEGVYRIGYSGSCFSFDNERPHHSVFIGRFEIATRPVSCGEFLQFIEDGGYRRPEFWLSAGWQQVRSAGWQAPLYWIQEDGEWRQFTLAGVRPLDPAEPVCHVSYFEADAFARWAGARLPTEFEWELASAGCTIEGNFVESGLLHPAPVRESNTSGALTGMFGDVWEWTSSSYSAYPGFEPAQGALGEYNGKFMCNQYVLRGGSCATPRSHIRPTYRNFFPPDAQWQFAGLRLCKRQ